MDYNQFHKEFIKLAPKKKNPMIDRIIPVDPGGNNLDIRIPVVKDFVNKFFKKQNLNFSQVVKLADQIFKHKITEEIVFAIELVAKYPQSKESSFFKHASGWTKFLTNWENCDRLCGQILGKILLKNPKVISQIQKWSESRLYWRRRCSIVCFIVPLAFEGRKNLYKKSDFIDACLKICAKLGKDEALYVQKAVGWPIREITKWSGSGITYDWLLQNKNKLSSFVWHASLEKFSKASKLKLKKYYKNGKNTNRK